MRQYIVVRHGSNRANQGMLQEMDIGIVEASDRDVARRRADKMFGHLCYANQHLRVIAASRVSADRWNDLGWKLTVSGE
jgi:hypothetical protein